MVVAMPSCASVGRPTTEFGATRMVSSPRIKRTRPLRPVRIVSPGLSTLSLLSATCCAPCVVSQTSPDDLLTDQESPSAAHAVELAITANAATTKCLKRDLADICGRSQWLLVPQTNRNVSRDPCCFDRSLTDALTVH